MAKANLLCSPPPSAEADGNKYFQQPGIFMEIAVLLYLSIMFCKTKQPITVTIPNPCHENWQQMDAVERGRFCQACQTVVTDFSALSDDEIIRHIEQAAEGKMCGRFSEYQINRALIPETKVHRISAFRKVAASVLMLYASLNEAMAQAPSAKPGTYTNAQKPAAKITGINISGKVIDFTGQGLAHFELQIVGTDSVKTTDAYGRFKFRLSDNFKGRELIIAATSNGQLLLDSTGSFINDTKVSIDTFPFRKQVTIYRYPLEVLNSTEIVTYKKYDNNGHTGIVEYKAPIPIDTNIKKISWQDFKDFFKK